MRTSSRLQPAKSPSSASKRSPNLHLPGLPRFHPANYATGSSVFSSNSTSQNTSVTSSTATSPPSNPNSPNGHPSSHTQHRPQLHVRQYSDAQRQLYAYQRDMLNQYSGITSRSSQTTSPGGGRRGSPRSPRLHPLGSPGPVTPLELEEHQHRDGYLFPSGGFDKQLREDAKDQILDSFIKKESETAARGDGHSGLGVPSSQNAHHARTNPQETQNGVRHSDHTNHRSVLSR